MKARIKETGEVLDIADYTRIIMNNCDSYGNPLEYALEEVELIDDRNPTDSIDWEKRRFELVKAVLQGFCANTENADTTYREFASDVVKLVDAVLAEYKKGGNNEHD